MKSNEIEHRFGGTIYMKIINSPELSDKRGPPTPPITLRSQ